MKRALYLFTLLVLLTVIPNFTFAANLRSRKAHHTSHAANPNLSLLSKKSSLLKTLKAQEQNSNTIKTTDDGGLLGNIIQQVRSFIYGTMSIVSDRCDQVATNCRIIRGRQVCDSDEQC
jgi:hypothetical protein